MALTPDQIVKKMLDKDFFSQWLGIEVMELEEGRCLLRMTVRKEMLNGFGIAHGGIAFALADSALAFAANTHGIQSVTVESGIKYFEKVEEGDVLLAEAVEVHRSRKMAHYRVEIFTIHGTPKAAFDGTVYRTGKEWE